MEQQPHADSPEPGGRLHSLKLLGDWQASLHCDLWSLLLRIELREQPEGITIWGRSCFDIGWDMQIRMRVGCFGAVRVCCVLFGKWDRIFLWSATPCDIPTHTLLLTFHLPLNSPAVVTFSGFLIYVLQDLKSDGRNSKKITSVDKHLYTSRSWYTLVQWKVE